jgi:aconitate hydratase
VARDAAAKGLKLKTPLLVTPGSDQIDETIRRDGQMAALEAIGATVLANACGPCIGQWKREDAVAGKRNSIVTSYNRNFKKRNDGHAETLAFIGSPELVVALALGGRLTFDPTRDTLTNDSGEAVKLDAPVGAELPSGGFEAGAGGYIEPADDFDAVAVEIAADSERLAPLEAFDAWNGEDFTDMPILIQASGKCTTDHISQAGPWLRFRGHLDRISDNMYLGAVNRFTGESGRVKNQIDGSVGTPPEVARAYKQAGLSWVVVADENYGEGSSREHAAMEPRHLGGRAVIARSMARIAETNLKKQGVLPLTFVDPADYDRFREDDRVSVRGLAALAPGSVHDLELAHADGTRDTAKVKHSMAANQIDWFKAGSALNLIAAQQV